MRNLKWWIIALVFFLITLGILIFLTCWDNEVKSQIFQFSGIVITGLGFFIAIYQLKITSNQYFADLKKKLKDYLDLSVETENIGTYYSIKTQVINKSGENKDIDYSFILITKQDENIIKKANQIAEFIQMEKTFEYSNCLNEFKNNLENPIFINNNIGIIPLDFYFSENISIGNENPSFTYSFDNRIAELGKGIYSVRFFIYPKEGYHRSTVDSLIVN